MPTLICTNALFLQHAAVCLTSLLANNPDLSFEIVVVHRVGQDLDEGKLRRSLAPFANHTLTFRAFAFPDDLTLPLIPGSYYTLDTYTRIWVAEFFAQSVSRVLYLDSDIVVAGNIAPLWNGDLGGQLLGAVAIPGSDRGATLLRLAPECGYFNAGVLLIDLTQWRVSDATNELLEYIRRYPERVLYDQDALNACFHDRWKHLPYKWNVIWPFYRKPCPLPLSHLEVVQVHRDAVVIHFNGGLKPWSYFCTHPRRAEYEKYLRMTEWRDYIPPDRTPLTIVQKHVSQVLPASVKRPIKALLQQLTSARAQARSR